ncbi:phosphoribosylanthranilate isomerase [Eupransor demetentiae]|uniref:N-(5'-phosphoribosyl)anthranilate isomerase n=1 Tax=Eupransor demetentiae TaxID=3109584 RepID=A0ABM9N3Y6_9LACO|nr:Phosphoribosylanthranilate isomerase (TrpF) [Lactobacillaceae bacterium LMG 33000]
MTKIKLCGNFRLEDVTYLNQVRPDFAGIVLSPGYRRSVSAELARQMRATLNPAIALVGVFVNADLDEILAYRDLLDYVQLHGQESEELVADLQKNGLKVIQVMQVDQQVPTRADYRLLDAGKGSGQTFDWKKIKTSSTPTILAGGLKPTNLKEAIATVQPDVVDISSGSEVDGLKNLKQMQTLVSIARSQI